MRKILLATFCLASLVRCSHAQLPPPATSSAAAPAPREQPTWIARSDENAQLLLAVIARFDPESAARLGVPGLDEEILDLRPGHRERRREATRTAVAQLEQRLAVERDPLVKQDLAILVHAGEQQIRGSELSEKYEVPYLSLPQLVFSSTRALLDPQVAQSRRPAALSRLRKYAGLEPGMKPLAQLAREETLAGLRRPELLPPSRLEVEYDLQTAEALIDGTEKLFREYRIAGSEAPLATLRAQLTEYVRFVREEVLPRSRKDFRLPSPLYGFHLERYGIDIPQTELISRARAAFTDIQGEMQAVAAQVARERNLPSPDYRDVIRELKKEQLAGDAILAHYQQRLAEIEGILRAHQLVTLPSRPARIRLGTPAENAQQPAPHMVPPRLLGNTGEQGEFVLPLTVPGASERGESYDDFTFAAASWTLTAHEARPGHEMQFSRMVENGVSIARAVFAFNSVNVEGWGLYSEAITLPFMPNDGKLISLQLRLQRAVRAFIDPELQKGKWTPESARAFLQKEVGLSPAFAKSEVDRYTFRAPGQATSYFYGYTRLLDLRREAEQRLGKNFDARRFHDVILAQGLLPPDLLRTAVLTALVGL